MTPCTVAHQAPLSMGFSRQDYWNGLPFPFPGDLPDLGIEPTTLMSPAFLGRKTMTNLHSILKGRDITLLTKASTDKAMVFSVVMYGCESWTIKKAEHQRIGAFEL